MLFINRAIASLKYHRRNSIITVVGMVFFMIIVLALQMLRQIETTISTGFMNNIQGFPKTIQSELQLTIRAMQVTHGTVLNQYAAYIAYTYLAIFIFLVVINSISLHHRQSELKAYSATGKLVSWISLQLFVEYCLLFFIAYVIVFVLGIVLTFVGTGWLRQVNQHIFLQQLPDVLSTTQTTAFIKSLFHQQLTFFNWQELLAGNTVTVNRIEIFTSGIRQSFFSFLSIVILAIIGSSWVGIHWWRFRQSRQYR